VRAKGEESQVDQVTPRLSDIVVLRTADRWTVSCTPPRCGGHTCAPVMAGVPGGPSPCCHVRETSTPENRPLVLNILPDPLSSGPGEQRELRIKKNINI